MAGPVKYACPGCKLNLMEVANICRRCRMCNNCYGCQKDRCHHYPVLLMYRKIRRRINTLPRLLGVEFEVSNIPKGVDLGRMLQAENRIIDPASGLTLSYDVNIHRDGSVIPSGFEAVTEPKVGDDYTEMMKKIINTFQSIKGLACNDSCGYHVHVDASQDSNQTFKNFLYLYLKLEDEIYRTLCHKSRIKNECCVPLHTYTDPYFKYDDLVSSELSNAAFFRMILSIYGIDTASDDYELLINHSTFKRLKNNRRAFGFERNHNPRYAGLNIHALFHMGTIEWRMKEGTIDPLESMWWPLFCGWFTHLGLSLPIKTLKGINSLDDFLSLPQLPKNVVANTRLMIEAVAANSKKKRTPVPEREEREVDEEPPGIAPPAPAPRRLVFGHGIGADRIQHNGGLPQPPPDAWADNDAAFRRLLEQQAAAARIPQLRPNPADAPVGRPRRRLNPERLP